VRGGELRFGQRNEHYPFDRGKIWNPVAREIGLCPMSRRRESALAEGNNSDYAVRSAEVPLARGVFARRRLRTLPFKAKAAGSHRYPPISFR
jgi:hypothetical protein